MNMIYRWKHPNATTHLLGIIQGFAEIADGLVILGSLGFFASSFEVNIARLRAKVCLNHRRKTHDREGRI